MSLKEVLQQRILELCKQHKMTPNGLAYHCGIDRSTIYSILGNKSKNPEVATIKKICDGLDITLAEFFNTDEFNNLEQGIK